MTPTHELLASALGQAADVARARLGRELEVREAIPGESTALLRFDLTFGGGALLSWFVSNDDATGFADMLIGGKGDRGAMLTEMHLDALSGVFSDMLERAVEGIAARLSEPLEAGGVDMGMEASIPDVPVGGDHLVLALDIAGFGPVVIVQHVNAAMKQHLVRNYLEVVTSAPVAAGTGGGADDAAPASAGPAPSVAQHAAALEADNVVPLRSAAPAARQAERAPGDLNMLMNVPLPLTVELGHTQRTIRELVEMSVGSIIELSKLAGDPLDIKVNDRVIARGEVVVIDEEFGIRVTEIVSPEERLRGLG